MKINKSERISTLEDAVGMNWTDMKKIETKISRAMTDMAIKISNIDLQLKSKQAQLDLAAKSIGLNKQAIIMIKNEREAEKELREVDLSNELTGSDLCQVMYARGATLIMCAVSNTRDHKGTVTKQHEIDIIHDLESFVSSTHPYVGFQNSYKYAVPINNQGEPLTAKEVGL